MISRNYSEKISFITFFPIFTNAPGLLATRCRDSDRNQRLAGTDQRSNSITWTCCEFARQLVVQKCTINRKPKTNLQHLNVLEVTDIMNWRILLVQSFTARMPSAFKLGGRRWRSPQQCYLHCLCTSCLRTLTSTSTRPQQVRNKSTTSRSKGV